MATERRFVRFILEGEFEVVDAVQARSYESDLTETSTGETILADGNGGVVGLVALSHAAFVGAEGWEEKYGIRVLSASAIARELDGEWYREHRVIPMPARSETGEIPDGLPPETAYDR